MPRFLSALTTGILVTGLLSSCKPGINPIPVTPITPTTQQADFKPIATKVNLPATIDYHDKDGTLKHLVYRSTFTYDNQNRLTAITDQLVADMAGAAPPPWAQFTYTDNRLTRIDLKQVSYNPDAPVAGENQKPARFDLTYTGSQVAAKLLIDGKEVQATTLSIDERGLPLKSSLTRLYFTQTGNIDQIAASQKYKAGGTEIIEQRYDTNSAVFSQLREMQLLDALLSTVNRYVSVSGITGLGSSLNLNNLVYTKRKNCDPRYGCREIDENQLETIELNDQGFPTLMNSNMSALGTFRFTVVYNRVNG